MFCLFMQIINVCWNVWWKQFIWGMVIYFLKIKLCCKMYSITGKIWLSCFISNALYTLWIAFNPCICVCTPEQPKIKIYKHHKKILPFHVNGIHKYNFPYICKQTHPTLYSVVYTVPSFISAGRKWPLPLLPSEINWVTHTNCFNFCLMDSNKQLSKQTKTPSN